MKFETPTKWADFCHRGSLVELGGRIFFQTAVTKGASEPRKDTAAGPGFNGERWVVFWSK